MQCIAQEEQVYSYSDKCVLLAITFILFARKFAATAVFAIAIHLRSLKNLEWLTVIPLLDFLNECSKPFERPEMNPKQISWLDVREKDLQLHEWKGKATPGYVHIDIYCLAIHFYFFPARIVNAELFEKFRPLFALDPLLLRTLIYLTPQQDLPAILKLIPPYLAVTWLASMARIKRTFDLNEVGCPILSVHIWNVV